MYRIGHYVVELVVAFLTALGLGTVMEILLLAVGAPGWLGSGKAGASVMIVVAAVSAAAIGNPVGIFLCALPLKKRSRLLWARVLVTFLFSIAATAGFFYLAVWLGSGLQSVLLCMGGVSIVSCVGWHLSSRLCRSSVPEDRPA